MVYIIYLYCKYEKPTDVDCSYFHVDISLTDSFYRIYPMFSYLYHINPRSTDDFFFHHLSFKRSTLFIIHHDKCD